MQKNTFGNLWNDTKNSQVFIESLGFCYYWYGFV
jgi:hypothetical protein